MEFATADLRRRLVSELIQATAADVAVAFFNPEPELLAALRSVPKLRLLVADDFQINNPDSLEALHSHGHWVRAVSAELHGGNLHAKVYLVRRKDKTLWAMIGSANFTRPGLVTNQEACIVLDERCRHDGDALRHVRNWLERMQGMDYDEIDFDLARGIYEAHGNSKATAGKASPTKPGTGFWAVKPGYCGNFWKNCLAESVVAIGWGKMGDASALDRNEAAKAYRKAWKGAKDRSVHFNVSQILKFAQGMSEGDAVLLCGRYDGIGSDDRDVYIYGVARLRNVGGVCYFYDEESDWYALKRHATIQKVMEPVRRSRLAAALNVKSIVPTVQELDVGRFGKLKALLRKELGVVIDV